jgi:hypothetical protein
MFILNRGFLSRRLLKMMASTLINTIDIITKRRLFKTTKSTLQRLINIFSERLLFKAKKLAFQQTIVITTKRRPFKTTKSTLLSIITNPQKLQTLGQRKPKTEKYRKLKTENYYLQHQTLQRVAVILLFLFSRKTKFFYM